MELRRRRTDLLPAPQALPLEPMARAQAACEALAACDIESSFGLQLKPGGKAKGMLCAAEGRVEHLLELGRDVAAEVVLDGRALRLVEEDDAKHARPRRLAAMPCGVVRDQQVVLVVSDPMLTQREAQAIAAWIAPPGAGSQVQGGACGALARTLAGEFDADVVVLALFAQSGMILNMHVRSGGLLRAWRVPVDTVWGEAARHGAAFVLGELQMHPGAECLASLGMEAAAIVGIENGNGVAVGSIGLGATRPLDMDIAHHLLERAPLLGPQIMSLKSRTPVPTPDESGAVELRGFAARVGCRRFAMYTRTGNVLRLVSAHDAQGATLVSPPDAHEEQLVCWAAEKGVAVASDDAAAVVVGGDTVLYAQDPSKRPIECLRLALTDLRRSPFEAGEDGRAAA